MIADKRIIYLIELVPGLLLCSLALKGICGHIQEGSHRILLHEIFGRMSEAISIYKLIIKYARNNTLSLAIRWIEF